MQPIKELNNFRFFKGYIKELKAYNKFNSNHPHFPYDELYNAMCSLFINNTITSYTTYHQSTLIDVL